MEYYIRGIGNISPQNTLNPRAFPEDLLRDPNPLLKCIHPDYKDYIDISSRRRMGNVVKMGIASALICLKDAGIENPGAIITCTGLGAVEDTEKFLNSMLDNKELLLNPATFIQTTYNTISSLIAIRLNCKNYNSTYVHRTFSFETGLIDALMLLDEQEAENILLGGVDDITQTHYTLFDKLEYWKKNPVDQSELIDSHSTGTIAGEGSTFINITNKEHPDNYCRIKGVFTLFSSDTNQLIKKFNSFIQTKDISLDDIDLIMLGLNGDSNFDDRYSSFMQSLSKNIPVAYYKHLCGDYYTSMAFATALSALAIYQNDIPEYMMYKSEKPKSIKNILIYNQFRGKEHSFILLGK
ncbi:MAG: beta-ketoacyl synthase chain length factor [Bacteroidota bacterium]